MKEITSPSIIGRAPSGHLNGLWGLGGYGTRERVKWGGVIPWLGFRVM